MRNAITAFFAAPYKRGTPTLADIPSPIPRPHPPKMREGEFGKCHHRVFRRSHKKHKSRAFADVLYGQAADMPTLRSQRPVIDIAGIRMFGGFGTA